MEKCENNAINDNTLLPFKWLTLYCLSLEKGRLSSFLKKRFHNIDNWTIFGAGDHAN